MKKLIHRFWDGPNPMPEHHKFYGEEWQRLNPDWTVKDWSVKDILWTPRNHAVLKDLANQASDRNADLVANATHVADVLAYEIIYNYGGLYVNTDMRPVRPMSEFFNQHPAALDMAAAGMEDEQWVVNAAIWAPEPENDFWLAVIKELPNRYFGNPGAYMNYTTGPHLLTDVFHKVPGLLVVNRNVFNPIHWSEFNYGEIPKYDKTDMLDETIVVHEWYHRTNQRNQRTLEVDVPEQLW